MKDRTLRERFHGHYHWIVAAAVFLEFTVSIGLANNLYSLYLIPVTQSLEVSRGAFSIAPSIKYLSAFFSNLIFGLLYRRFGYRWTTTAALCLTGCAYFSYMAAESLVPFYFGAVVTGLMEPFVSTAGTSRIISEWFKRRQGLILGVVMASSGVGGTLFSVLITAVMEKNTWRTAMGLSAAVLLCSAAAIFLLARDNPAKMGLRPFGAEDAPKAQKQAKQLEEWEGLSLAVLKRRPYFILALVATFLVGIVNYGVYPVIAAYVQDQGMSAVQAASVQGVMFLTMALAKIFEGAMCDKFSAKSVMIGCLLCTIFGLVFLILSRNEVMAMAGAILFSVGLAVPSIMLPVLTAELFGRRDYGTVLGLTLAMVSLSGVVSSPAVNFSYDLLGSYIPAFFAMIGISVVTLVLYLLVFQGVRKEREKKA